MYNLLEYYVLYRLIIKAHGGHTAETIWILIGTYLHRAFTRVLSSMLDSDTIVVFDTIQIKHFEHHGIGFRERQPQLNRNSSCLPLLLGVNGS